MTITVGILNLILGSVYTCYGIMTIADMRRGRKENGFSHFGAAWIAMAFTCGPHHLAHASHLLFEGRRGGPLDLLAVVVGFPAGVAWFLLRVEALRGGKGDRALLGNPAWVEWLPTLSGVYVAALATAAIGLEAGVGFKAVIAPNLALILLYCGIGFVLLRTQLDNHALSGEWSVSGLALTVVFPTCALMHGVYSLYVASGRYGADIHALVIDTIGVPAAAYFLWVVWSLHHGRLIDWNRAAVDTTVRVPPGREAPVTLVRV